MHMKNRLLQEPSTRVTLQQTSETESIDFCETMLHPKTGCETPIGRTARRSTCSCNVVGTISSDTTWDKNEIHEITSDLTIASGATLTDRSGRDCQFHHSNVDLFVDGTLNAQGTAAEPIVMTSFRDDVGGDTNGDGATTLPAPGQWARLQVNGSAIIANADIRYGGYFYGTMVLVNAEAWNSATVC